MTERPIDILIEEAQALVDETRQTLAAHDLGPNFAGIANAIEQALALADQELAEIIRNSAPE